MNLSPEFQYFLKTESVLDGARIVAHLPGGPVSETVLLELGGQRAVLRIDSPLARCLALDRERELRVLLAAESAGFGPAVMQAWPSRGALLTRWVPGKSWGNADMQQSDQLTRLGQRLRDLHCSRIDMPALDLRVAIDAYAADKATPAIARMRREALLLLDDLSKTNVAPVPCHNDLTANNIIEKQKVIFIDWEYGGLCDPLFDIAGILHQNRLSGAAAAILLQSYGLHDARDPAATRRLEAFQRVYAIIAALWGRVAHPESTG